MSSFKATGGLETEYQALLKSVADELKLPLMHIARQSELAGMGRTSAQETLVGVGQSARSALELVDSYLLGLQLAENQQLLELEPVSAASVIYDVAGRLEEIARRRGVSLAVELPVSLDPVMAHRAGLQSALLSLGTAVISAQPQVDKPLTVTLAAYRARGGIITGLYAEGLGISPAELRAAERLTGGRRQPLRRFSAGPSAGIFVAQNILRSMASNLKAVRYHKQSGLAAVLTPSQQLKLV